MCRLFKREAQCVFQYFCVSLAALKRLAVCSASLSGVRKNMQKQRDLPFGSCSVAAGCYTEHHRPNIYVSTWALCVCSDLLHLVHSISIQFICMALLQKTFIETRVQSGLGQQSVLFIMLLLCVES